MWSLNTQKGYLLPHVKTNVSKGISCLIYQFTDCLVYALHPSMQFCTILSRFNGSDCLQFYQISKKAWILLKECKLPTIDSTGIHWSPDGNWLAVLENVLDAVVYIYHRTGLLFHEYRPNRLIEVGFSDFEWSPFGKYLTLCSYHDSTLHLLETKTFSIVFRLHHCLQYTNTDLEMHIWEEKETIYEQQMTYQKVHKLRTDFPEPSFCSASKIRFNCDETYAATITSKYPNVLWLWNLQNKKLHTVLIQKHHIVYFEWHPGRPDLVVIQTKIRKESKIPSNATFLYFWALSWNTPRVVGVPKKGFNIQKVQWLQPSEFSSRPVIVICGEDAYTVAYIVEDEDESFTEVTQTIISQEVLDNELETTQTISIPS